MKVLITEEFNFDLGDNKTLYCSPSEIPYTIIRAAGEAAIAAGCGIEVADGKPKTSAKAGNLGGGDTGADVGTLPGDTGIDGVDSDDNGSADAGEQEKTAG